MDSFLAHYIDCRDPLDDPRIAAQLRHRGLVTFSGVTDRSELVAAARRLMVIRPLLRLGRGRPKRPSRSGSSIPSWANSPAVITFASCAAETTPLPLSSALPATAPSRRCWTARVPRRSTPAAPATSNSPVSAAFTDRRRRPWAYWPSRSNFCAPQPGCCNGLIVDSCKVPSDMLPAAIVIPKIRA
jgi:hypothetical protein